MEVELVWMTPGGRVRVSVQGQQSKDKPPRTRFRGAAETCPPHAQGPWICRVYPSEDTFKLQRGSCRV